MPLPLVMMRDLKRGVALSLVHLDPDGTTCRANATAERVIDEKIQVASLGIEGQKQTAVTIAYPATEGQRSYVPGHRRRRGKCWVERFHPIREGFSHRYSVLLHLQTSEDFRQAMRATWRSARSAKSIHRWSEAILTPFTKRVSSCCPTG